MFKGNQLDNKINQLEKCKLDVSSLRENHKEFIKNNKQIVKSQQGLRSQKQSVFTKEVNKIVSSANNDKIIK